MQRGVLLGMLPSFTDEDVRDIVAAIRKVLVASRERAARRIDAGVR